MRAEGCFMAFSIRMKKCRAAFAARRRVIPAGFEPTTDSLEGCCSIQLSYETMSIFGCKSTKFRSIYKFISCFLVLSASDGRRFIPDRASAEAPLSLVKTSRTVCPACFESSAGAPVFGAGRWRRCGCEADLRRLFPDLLCYLFRYLSRYIFSSRGMTGLVMNPLHPASSAVRRSVSKA